MSKTRNPTPDPQHPTTENVEVEIEMCCDSLLDAINNGGVQVIEVSPGIYREVIADEGGKTGIAINYCPFCGTPKQAELPPAPAD
jgi:hypothetical protein